MRHPAIFETMYLDGEWSYMLLVDQHKRQLREHFDLLESVISVLLPGLLLLSACSPQGVDDGDIAAYPDIVELSEGHLAPPENQALSQDQDLCSTEVSNVDFMSWVTDTLAALPPENSDAYLPPTAYERAIFKAAATALLEGRCRSATRLARQAGYSLVALVDGEDRFYYMDPDRPENAPRGIFVVRDHEQWQRLAAMESPHPIFDEGTGILSARAFADLGAAALAIAGAHRCANIEFGNADGQTRVCNDGQHNPYRESDMAHSASSFFQAFHEAFADTFDDSVAVQLHVFMQGESDPMFKVSDGTTIDCTGRYCLSNRMHDELLLTLGRFWQQPTGASCNLTGHADSLCATTNVQGRYSNGVRTSRAHRTPAEGSSGRFLHIELGTEPRFSDGRGDGGVVLEALEYALLEME